MVLMRKGTAKAEPSAEQVELARRFIALESPAEMIMEGFKSGFWGSASEILLEIEDAGDRSAAEDRIDQLLVGLEPKLKELMPAFLEAHAQVYAREFSADELQQMVAFAGTPAGKHYLASVDNLAMDPALEEAQQELMSGLAPALKDFKKAMCAETAAKRVAAGDTSAKCNLG